MQPEYRNANIETNDLLSAYNAAQAAYERMAEAFAASKAENARLRDENARLRDELDRAEGLRLDLTADIIGLNDELEAREDANSAIVVAAQAAMIERLQVDMEIPASTAVKA
jgi:hypothetical protein